MSKVVVFTNLTLDGVMQAPGRPDEDCRGGFEHGGWATPYAAMSAFAGYDTDVCSLSRGQNFCRVEEESRRLIKHPGSLRLGQGAETPAHARSAEQAMPPGPTLDRGG